MHIDAVVSCKERDMALAPVAPVPFVAGETAGRRAKGFTITIDESQRYQSMLGLGYSFEHTSCFNFMQLAPADRRKVLAMLVDPIEGAGMNLWRLCIGTPDFTYEFYSYDDMPPGETDPDLACFSIEKDREFVIPVVKEALAINPAIVLFASPWSPPGWMKGPEKKLLKGKADVEGGKGLCGGRLLPEWYDAYARYLVKYLQAYQDEGIPIAAITVQNEPHHNWTLMPTCYWRAEEERDFIKHHLGPRLREAGLDTGIWCWDHNWGMLAPASYPGVVLSDPGAASFVSGIAFHHYSWVNVGNMTRIHARFPGTPIHFTEGSLLGLWGASRMASYLRAGCSSYVGWVPCISYPRGLPNLGPFKTTRTMIQRTDGGRDDRFTYPENAVLIRFDYYIQSHFYKFIQRGATRVKSSTRQPFLVSEVSFANPDGSLVSIVTNRRRKPLDVSVRWRGQVARLTVPAKAIATLCWGGGEKP